MTLIWGKFSLLTLKSNFKKESVHFNNWKITFQLTSDLKGHIYNSISLADDTWLHFQGLTLRKYLSLKEETFHDWDPLILIKMLHMARVLITLSVY